MVDILYWGFLIGIICVVFLPVVLGYVVARGARDVSVGMVFNKKSASGRKTRVRLHSATLEVLISTIRTISVWLIAHREKNDQRHSQRAAESDVLCCVKCFWRSFRSARSSVGEFVHVVVIHWHRHRGRYSCVSAYLWSDSFGVFSNTNNKVGSGDRLVSEDVFCMWIGYFK